MKQSIITLSFLFALFCSIGTQAQEVLIQGSRLDIGSGNEFGSYYSGAIGLQNFAAGANSLVIGYKDTIPDGSTNSFAAGGHNRINGINSFAIGGNVKALGSLTVGIGYFLKARNENNFVMGCGIQGNNTNPNLFLENTNPYSMMIGFHSTKPTLTIGPSPNNYPTGELFDLTGKVAIGNVPVSEIAAKLHIRSDEGEDAGVFLEPAETKSAFVRLLDKGHEIRVNSNGTMQLISINNPFQIESRNVSIINGEFTLGSYNDHRIKLITTDFPSIYANASRSGNSYVCYDSGASFALEFNNNAMLFRTAYTSNNSRTMEITNWSNPLCLKTNGSIVMNGRVGVNIENTTADYALSVDGGIITTKVYIQDVEDWPDYVFDENYNLMSLQELKKYIVNNKHLPEMPSENDIVGRGFDIQEIQQAMMKKIEELTLYVLQQQEEIEELKEIIDKLKEK